MLLAVFAATLMPASFAPGADAAGTILPSEDPFWEDSGYPCEPEKKEEWAKFWGPLFDDQEMLKEKIELLGIGITEGILACAIKSGNIRFWMVPYFILHALEFIVSLAALLAILMIIVGAYYYMYGGLTDDKEKGKTIIKYAIGGLILSTLSWVITNIILAALTS